MGYKWPMHPFRLEMKRSSYSLSRETLEELPAQEMRKKEEDVYIYRFIKAILLLAIKGSDLSSVYQIYVPAP